MRRIKLTENRWIGEGEYPFVVAEIGNNHNGSMEIAKELIRKAKDLNVDAVKFQKKDVENAFNKKLLDMPYLGPNSFGETYREHKQFLELSPEQMREIKHCCDEIGIVFFCTPFDKISVDVLQEIGNPFYKIASFHVTDLELIEYVCQTKKPILMSTGMSTIEEIDKAVDLIRKYTAAFALLHCVSSYPCEEKDVNLRVINTLRERYDCPVGYSGHEKGTALCSAAVMHDACVIERHFTLDRTMKGSDHASSVEPSGMDLIVRRCQRFFEALGSPEKRVLECELAAREKFREY